MAKESIPLEMTVANGKIADVGTHRHRVHWDFEENPSSITYCNRCGCPFIFCIKGSDVCGDCGVEQPEERGL